MSFDFGILNRLFLYSNKEDTLDFLQIMGQKNKQGKSQNEKIFGNLVGRGIFIFLTFYFYSSLVKILAFFSINFYFFIY